MSLFGLIGSESHSETKNITTNVADSNNTSLNRSSVLENAGNISLTFGTGASAAQYLPFIALALFAAAAWLIWKGK